MALARFSVIVAIDKGNGISKEGALPWNSRSDMKFFRDTTVGRGRNAVIMGRVTYESIPLAFRPLSRRHCVVISRTWRQEDHPEISVCGSLLDALQNVGGSIKKYDEVFVAGGETIYRETLRDYMYLCNKVYVTRFKTDFGCDQFFNWEVVAEYPTAKEPEKTRDFVRHFLTPDVYHEEYQYLEALKAIALEGDVKPDRTGIGTRSIFGVKISYDISERLPIFTTKKIFYESILKELLFFISGKTDTNILVEQGVGYWKDNTSREFLDGRKLEYEEGDMGPLYGFQWRHWGAEYEGMDGDYAGKGVDQLTKLIEGLKSEPHSRRHILSAWNVSQLDEMCLPPCHLLAQFYVSGDRRHLDCQLYQRSGDMFLGVPFNVGSYSLLTHMIGHLTGLRPRRLIHIIGDAHVYSNHIEQVNRQLGRTPRPFPRLKLRGAARIHTIDDFDFDSFIIEGYSSWPHISAPMAV